MKSYEFGKVLEIQGVLRQFNLHKFGCEYDTDLYAFGRLLAGIKYFLACYCVL